MGDYFVRYLARFDFAGPAEHSWHPVGTLPVCVFFAAERCHPCIRPAIHVRTVVGRVRNEGVVCDAKIIQCLEYRANVLVMVDHGVMVRALPATSLAQTFRLSMSAQVHMGEVHPDEEWFVGVVLSLDEVRGPVRDVVVDR